ncbi:hypothetical protein [Modestobacter altitudinis]|uniref:hypothetical protein n=1 Tax=Modestobacter altitudinis TaxID=2213158 RepID=UPI00110D1690|nr:hypothetical protein [Modestobacter altitudinis]
MTVAHTQDAPPRSAAPPTRTVQRLLLGAAGWSLLQLLLGVRWIVDPDSWPGFDDEGRVGLLAALHRIPSAWLVIGLAATGLLLALLARWRPSSRAVAAALAVQAGLLLGVAADVGVLTLLGYLCAIVGPAAFLVVFAVGAVRDRRVRPWLLGVGALVAAGVVSGVLRPATISRLAGQLSDGFAEHASPPAHLGLVLVGAALFGTVAVLLRRAATGRCRVCGRPAARWTEPAAALRWGRVATWIAVACPLPYALVRMTWLTPWPLGMPEGGDLEPAMRLFGLGLGFAALGGAVLTAGLLRPWGETWPSWVPVLRGRPVPVVVPVLAGGLVALVLLASTPGMVALAVEEIADGNPMGWLMLLLFPTLPWGLALGAAVTAYALRRRGACRTCGQGEPGRSVRA